MSHQSQESPALWFLLGAAVPTALLSVPYLLRYVFPSPKCPFSSQPASTQPSTLPPTTEKYRCPYLASQNEQSEPIDMTRFLPQRSTTQPSTTSPPASLDHTSTSSSSTTVISPGPKTGPKKGAEAVHYHKYLDLDAILTSQRPLSWTPDGTNAHDEHLFIVTHQASELWFKEIIFDLLSVINIMKQSYISENSMSVVLERLNRISKIQKLLVEHLDVLASTMSPLNFLEFRDYLFPASGFQSFQFRQVECLLGLSRTQRLTYAGSDYDTVLLPEQQQHMRELETTVPTLFSLVDRWLCRTPILELEDYQFWTQYQKAVYAMLSEQEIHVKNQYLAEHSITKPRYDAELIGIQQQRDFFDSFFNEEKYVQALQPKDSPTTLSYRAVQASVMIFFYQELPLFSPAFQLLNLLQDIDTNFAQWRSRHSEMVFRMLGSKMGTGGSSGFAYLNETIQKHRIFHQFSSLSSLMVPRHYLAPLPERVLRSSTFFPDDFSPITSSTQIQVQVTTIDVSTIDGADETSLMQSEGSSIIVVDAIAPGERHE